MILRSTSKLGDGEGKEANKVYAVELVTFEQLVLNHPGDLIRNHLESTSEFPP